MVQFEKKTMVARSFSKGGRKTKSREKELETNVLDYGDSQIEGTDVIVSVAVATFVLKKEDRHQVLRLGDDTKFRTLTSVDSLSACCTSLSWTMR